MFRGLVGVLVGFFWLVGWWVVLEVLVEGVADVVLGVFEVSGYSLAGLVCVFDVCLDLVECVLGDCDGEFWADWGSAAVWVAGLDGHGGSLARVS